ncbi:VIT1/CCC1 transporter family protein [Acinetobacter tianfuensis]|uniref:VIT family protein n=1 Tax=Acinetobacter tianfuensis TaxID=2419603 RepID=A0A3A8EMB3_9GAMM|nr:VIT family protein [Acinetobacter tianfuensis]RKG31104.1 VIT family protein [Acinetobacter tianfuensis]
MPSAHHSEHHYIHRTGWLRASVLGANDGIISVTSLIMGLAASGASSQTLLITCVAGLISGAVSMAAGEYISVKSQEDIEKADLAMEHKALKHQPEAELKELTQIYITRGLSPELAHDVAVQLTAHDALAAHARDEIGIHDNTAAKPVQAAISSALAFSSGALLPMLAILLSSEHNIEAAVAIVGVLSLVLLGALSSYAAGTSVLKGSLRVTLWGIAAMLFSSWIGSFFNTAPI